MNGVPEHHCHKRCLSWTAIIAGAFVGIGLTFLLNLFNVAIGLTVFSFTNNGPTLLLGGFLALLVSVIVSMFFSGYVAGFLGRPYCLKRNTGIVYGFVTWTLALILTAFLASHVGRFVYTYSHFVTDPTTIILTTDEGTPTSTVKTNKATQAPTELIVNVDRTQTSYGIGALVIFILFAVGAFFSCLGGVCGMTCCDDACSGRKCD